ncbi:MAG TPA: selenocysteine-specific translation elongation factor [Longimicrobiales bacterium]|nr:selenocysteine-specific translation elongation factor [Longimicrobiales bacterium]
MRRLVLGTAGHIDHGKTALVRALTGTDTDRLPEEKQRGITIDLGFARLDGQGDAEVAIVDVPGHEHFVRNMLAGASGIDAVLLVVAADEGVMPQTREHVAIAELLGIRHAVVAVTKTDLVDDAWLELALDDVRSYLDGTAFAGAPIVAASAVDGGGLEALRAALARVLAGIDARQEQDAFRLPVDRVFTVRGTGTVVTGSVWSGRVRHDAALRLLPSDRAVRVRGLHRHGEPVDEVAAGARAALALAGIDREDASRGDVLVDDAPWPVSRRITARLRVIPDTDWDVRQRQRVRLHLGTAEVMARVVLLDGGPLRPGGDAWVQLRLEKPVVARVGDRFVVRSYSPVTTIGGGRVVEIDARGTRPSATGTRPSGAAGKPASEDAQSAQGAADDRASYLDLLHAGPLADALRARIGAAGLVGVQRTRLPFEVAGTTAAVEGTLPAVAGIVAVGDRVFSRAALDGVADALVEAVGAYHRAQPLERGMPVDALRAAAPAPADVAAVEHVLSGLVERGRLKRDGASVALPSFEVTLSPDQERLRDTVLATYEQAGLAPPAPADLPGNMDTHEDRDAVVELLAREGAIVALKPDLFFARSALEHAAAEVRRRLAGRDGLRPADFRTALAVSRKYLIPLLEHLDARGVTVRRGDTRSVPAVGGGSTRAGH